MQKKSAPARGNRPDNGPAHKKEKKRAQKPGRGEKPDKTAGRQGMRKKRKLAGGNAGGGIDNGFADIGKKLTGGAKNAKKGCFPKLLMLFLPFMAVGAYFLQLVK
jgi:hypothetical protein